MPNIMTHIVAGYPSLPESEAIALSMIKSGVSHLEIQIPFRDPIADGPVIAQANHIALENGTKLNDCFKLLQRLRAKTDIPLYFMTYYNIPFAYGLDRFCQKAKGVGCNGFIIPDIPYDEEANTHYLSTCKKYNLSPILIATPLTPDKRLQQIAKHSKDMIYCVSGVGTTGKKQNFNTNTKAYLENVRKHTKVPLALGFGVSTQQDVQEAGSMADIVVIGSHMIRLYEQEGLNGIEAFLTSQPPLNESDC